MNQLTYSALDQFVVPRITWLPWYHIGTTGIMIFCLILTRLKTKKPRNHRDFEVLICFSFYLAEEEGFEPPVPCGTTVFKTAAFDRSATPLCFAVYFGTANLYFYSKCAKGASPTLYSLGGVFLLFNKIHKNAFDVLILYAARLDISIELK